jgi:hypothetical protein
LRRVFVWITPAVLACAVLSIGLAGVAQAGKSPASSPVTGKAQPGVVLANHKLLQTALSPQGFSGAVAPPGFFAVDAPQTISCKLKTNCIIEAIMMVQFGSGVYGETPGPWAICLNVDGNYNTCPFYDDGHNNGFFTTGTATGFLTGLGAGNHTVQTFLYTSNGTTVYNYDVAYHSYS